uniref:ADAM metallopeptidase domain 29 n=1 Tax=Canis lupus familiaris TaxID=9615 RepID=A0A8C0NQ33_CANLF
MTLTKALLYMRIIPLLPWLGVFLSFCEYPQAEDPQYQNTPEVVIPLKIPDTSRGMKPSGWLSYSLRFGGRRHIVHMKAKKYLLSRHLPVFTYTDQGALLEDQPFVPKDCYYHGYVEGDPESLVSLSSCSGGFQGLLQINDFAYEIKPMTFSTKFEHLVYKMDSEKTQISGMNSDFMQEETVSQLESQKMNNSTQKQSAYSSWWVHMYIMELAVVVDHSLYVHIKKNISKFNEDLYAMVNIVDSIYDGMGLKLSLFGLEFWTERNYVQVNDAHRSLRYFCVWKNSNFGLRLQHDTVHLFINQTVRGMSGLGYRNGMCQPLQSCAIITTTNKTLNKIAIAIAHHLGHNLGMTHDDAFCKCGHPKCIMHVSNPPVTAFSNCSYSYFWSYSLQFAQCLFYKTHPKDIFSKKRCGDGIVEADEECDCGSLQSCSTDACCLTNCTLTCGSICAFGLCCKDCQLLPPGIMCRKEVSECDLPEWCDGRSPFCPKDVYVEDGIPCNESAYCYEKKCNNRNDQCKQIFGEDAISASPSCYNSMNTRGDRFGNCGILKSTYIKCNVSDSQCGRIQCDKVTQMPLLRDHSTVIHTHFNNVICWGIDYHFGMTIPDLGEVKDGTECGPEHICMNRKCVHLSGLDSNCTPKFCNMRGICNNKHHCHCNSFWDPPNCLIRGNGGSIDSGPPPKREKIKKKYLLIASLFWLLLLLCCLLCLCIRRKKKEVPAQPDKQPQMVPPPPAKPEKKVPPPPPKPQKMIPPSPAKPPQKAPTQPAKPPQKAPTQPAKPQKKAPTQPAKPQQKPSAQFSKSQQQLSAQTSKSQQQLSAQSSKSQQKLSAQPLKSQQKLSAQPSKSQQKLSAQPSKSQQTLKSQSSVTVGPSGKQRPSVTKNVPK